MNPKAYMEEAERLRHRIFRKEHEIDCIRQSAEGMGGKGGDSPKTVSPEPHKMEIAVEKICHLKMIWQGRYKTVADAEFVQAISRKPSPTKSQRARMQIYMEFHTPELGAADLDDAADFTGADMPSPVHTCLPSRRTENRWEQTLCTKKRGSG